MTGTETDENGLKEKTTVALSSVIAAVGLTAFKIVVGVMTGSLGILAEAAHSGLDMVAALVTFLAVRISGKPADEEHLYGHGKVENLSALFETLLLLATCVWIIYEAVQRLFYVSVAVEVSAWSFLVMATSIVIDISRSRMLYRAARKYNSQALEADALHFSTDIWSSSVVILGLTGMLVARLVPSLTFLEKADSISALVVALIVVYVSFQLGLRTVKALLDTAPEGLNEKIIEAVKTVEGVSHCHRVRVRYAGPHIFVDLHVEVKGTRTLNKVHGLTHEVINAVRKALPGADVTVHAEPLDEL